MSNMMIDISSISLINPWLRSDPDDALLESIKEVGLLNPLVVNKRLELIAGGRRFAALKKLKMRKARVFVLEGSNALVEELVGIDENICRLPLNTAEVEEALIRKEEILHELHPERRPEAIKRNARSASLCNLHSDVKSDAPVKKLTTQTFAAEEAKKLGVDRTTIQRGMNRAKKSSPAVKEARRKGEITASHADVLIKVPKEEQDKILPKAKQMKANELKEYVDGIKKGSDELEEDKKIRRLMSNVRSDAKSLRLTLKALEHSGIIVEGAELITVNSALMQCVEEIHGFFKRTGQHRGLREVREIKDGREAAEAVPSKESIKG